MSTSEEQVKKPQAGRRSSLKSGDVNSKINPHLIDFKGKRHSVSWGQCNTFKFKAMKAMFQEAEKVSKPEKENEEKHKKFDEIRRKSIKNEFSIVKEMMKNKNIIEEEEVDEEVKKNTDKNLKMGHEALNEESDSGSNPSEDEGEKNK